MRTVPASGVRDDEIDADSDAVTSTAPGESTTTAGPTTTMPPRALPLRQGPTKAGPLLGTVIVVDPGHNGQNYKYSDVQRAGSLDGDLHQFIASGQLGHAGVGDEQGVALRQHHAHADDTAGRRRINRAHLALLHEALRVVVGQKAQELPRQNQGGNGLLVKARGLARQAHALAFAARQQAAAFAQQLEQVRPAPAVPEWERIAQEMQLVAARAVNDRADAATFEVLYSSFSRMHVQKTWDAILNAPVSLDDIEN